MNYHPEHDWLAQFAAGTLPEALALCVSTHLSFCSECRRQFEALQCLGGLLLEQIEPTPVDEALLQQVLERIDDEPPVLPAAPLDKSVRSIPKPLRQLIASDYERLNWSWLMPALSTSPLPIGDGDYRVALHRIKAGGKVAMHDHRGMELTLVLRGSFSDEFGVYGDGDFIVRAPNQLHRPLAAQNEECICLTVMQGPVRLTGFWRWLNPLLH